MNLVKLKLEEFSLFICCCLLMKTSVEDPPTSLSSVLPPQAQRPSKSKVQ